MKNQNQKTSSGVALTQAQWERCDRLANETGCRSRNAFIRDAIDFYCSWLEKEQTERFLTPALESVISAKIRDSEERINRNLFKIAVDLSVLAKITLDEDAAVMMKIISPSFAATLSVRCPNPTARFVWKNASSKEN